MYISYLCKAGVAAQQHRMYIFYDNNVFKITTLAHFRIYDMDNDGYISNGELFQVLKMMVGSNLKDTQLQQVPIFWIRPFF
jgi:hypothetical protein